MFSVSIQSENIYKGGNNGMGINWRCKISTLQIENASLKGNVDYNNVSDQFAIMNRRTNNGPTERGGAARSSSGESKKHSTGSRSDASAARGGNPRKVVTCYGCNKPGHIRAECPNVELRQRKRNGRGSEPDPSTMCREDWEAHALNGGNTRRARQSARRKGSRANSKQSSVDRSIYDSLQASAGNTDAIYETINEVREELAYDIRRLAMEQSYSLDINNKGNPPTSEEILEFNAATEPPVIIEGRTIVPDLIEKRAELVQSIVRSRQLEIMHQEKTVCAEEITTKPFAPLYARSVFLSVYNVVLKCTSPTYHVAQATVGLGLFRGLCNFGNFVARTRKLDPICRFSLRASRAVDLFIARTENPLFARRVTAGLLSFWFSRKITSTVTADKTVITPYRMTSEAIPSKVYVSGELLDNKDSSIFLTRVDMHKSSISLELDERESDLMDKRSFMFNGEHGALGSSFEDDSMQLIDTMRTELNTDFNNGEIHVSSDFYSLVNGVSHEVESNDDLTRAAIEAKPGLTYYDEVIEELESDGDLRPEYLKIGDVSQHPIWAFAQTYSDIYVRPTSERQIVFTNPLEPIPVICETTTRRGRDVNCSYYAIKTRNISGMLSRPHLMDIQLFSQCTLGDITQMDNPTERRLAICRRLKRLPQCGSNRFLTYLGHGDYMTRTAVVIEEYVNEQRRQLSLVDSF